MAGAEWVHLRPPGLFANVIDGGYPISGAHWSESLERRDPVREFLPDVAYPFMDEADLADIAARLLLDDHHVNGPWRGRLDVVGCLSSARERVEILNEVLGIPVHLEQLADPDAARRYWRGQGWPEVTVEVTLYAMQAFHHAPAAIRESVAAQIASAESLLGRRPRTFREWAVEHRPALVPDRPAEPARPPTTW